MLKIEVKMSFEQHLQKNKSIQIVISKIKNAGTSAPFFKNEITEEVFYDENVLEVLFNYNYKIVSTTQIFEKSSQPKRIITFVFEKINTINFTS